MPGGLQSTALVEMLASSWKVAQWTRKERADAGGGAVTAFYSENVHGDGRDGVAHWRR